MNCSLEYLKTCTIASRECSLIERKPPNVIELWILIAVASVVAIMQMLETCGKTIYRFRRRLLYGSQLHWEQVVARENQKMADVDMDVRVAVYRLGGSNFEIKARHSEHEYLCTDKLISLYDRFVGFKYTAPLQPQGRRFDGHRFQKFEFDTPTTNVTPLLSANPAAATTVNKDDEIVSRYIFIRLEMTTLGWIRGQWFDENKEGWMWAGGKEPGEILQALLKQYDWYKDDESGGWFEPNYN